MVRPEAKRREADYLLEKYKISRCRVCKVLGLKRSTLDYKAHPRSDEPVRSKLLELATQYKRFGHPRLHVLLGREGIFDNHKRTHRIYTDLGLQAARRKRKRLGSRQTSIRRATSPNEVWAIDFMFDRLESGRQLKVFTIVDEFSKLSPATLVSHSIRGRDVAEFLSSVCKPLPKIIRVDQGTEFTSKAFLRLAYQNNIELQFTKVRRPNQVIESFNSRVRDEVLNEHVFFTLEDARKKIDKWHWDYNHFNPHSSLGMKTPIEFAKEREAMLSA